MHGTYPYLLPSLVRYLTVLSVFFVLPLQTVLCICSSCTLDTGTSRTTRGRLHRSIWSVEEGATRLWSREDDCHSVCNCSEVQTSGSTLTPTCPYNMYLALGLPSLSNMLSPDVTTIMNPRWKSPTTLLRTLPSHRLHQSRVFLEAGQLTAHEPLSGAYRR